MDKLRHLSARYDEISMLLTQPEIIADSEKLRVLSQEHAELSEIAENTARYEAIQKNLAEARQMLELPDMRELAQEEIAALESEGAALYKSLLLLLVPKDPNDRKNVVVEIRAGTGGEEAALFAGDLLRMYQRYAERQGWKVEIMDLSDTGIGGIKEAVFVIQGKGAYSRLKFESGVHRVQRVPQTESSGRIHTSAATVAVLPEAEDVDIHIDPNDLRIDIFRSGGHGGQSVNTTDSAVRITHLPTGLVVTCQDERSQLKNKDKALRVLRARLMDMMETKAHQEMADKRRGQVGSGDRSERIRTYNFPQGRVTDHRIGLTLYKLPEFIDGDMDEILQALIAEDEARRLSELNEG